MKETITVIGGGIVGLSAAYMAAKAGYQVRIIEKNDACGGLLGTFAVGNERVEHFYHHLFTHDAELLWLIGDLDLKERLSFHNTTMGVFRNRKIYDFNSPGDLLKFEPLHLSDKILFSVTSLFLGRIARWEKHESVSAMQWLDRWAGKGSTTSLWKPLLKVKFGPHADEVPLSWMIGRLRQRMGSRTKGHEQLGYLNGSFAVLVDRLLQRLQDFGAVIINGAPVEAFHIHNGKLDGIRTPKGFFQDGIFLATIPQPILAQTLRPSAPQLAQRLSEVKYFGAVCTVLELKRPLSHVYWTNVADEGFPFGGIIEHTNFISPEKYRGNHIVYLSRYYSMEEEISRMDDASISQLMISALYKIYPDFDPSWIKNVHVFRTDTAATVCDLNFSRKVPHCKSEINNLYIANMSHAYPDERSVNNAIRISAEALKTMGLETDLPPHGSSLAGKIGFTANEKGRKP